jgi:LPXTG-motif cell wall-anchored protein
VYAKDVEIIIAPKGQLLFDITNMKPGDWGQRKLSIKNGGDKDFYYSIIVTNNSNNNTLYDELELKISSIEKEQVLYNGKLKDYKNFEPKFLKKEASDHILFTVKMPFELGNEFQGTNANFEIKIIAGEKLIPPITDVDDVNIPPSKVDSDTNVNPSTPAKPQGSKLPNTATNVYNLLLIGTVLMAMGLLLFLVTGRLNRKNYNGKR